MRSLCKHIGHTVYRYTCVTPPGAVLSCQCSGIAIQLLVFAGHTVAPVTGAKSCKYSSVLMNLSVAGATLPACVNSHPPPPGRPPSPPDL